MNGIMVFSKYIMYSVFCYNYSCSSDNNNEQKGGIQELDKNIFPLSGAIIKGI